MIETIQYEGIQIKRGQKKGIKDLLAAERPLQIRINGEPLSITMCSPGDEKALVLGLLHSEDIYRDLDAAASKEVEIDYDSTITTADIQLSKDELREGYSNSRQLLSVASCGICGRTSFHPPEGEILSQSSKTISAESISAAYSEMSEHQRMFKSTGGSHQAGLFDTSMNLISAKEDIGRHNAVDKVIGEGILENKLKQAQLLCVSGRISYEIVAKTFMAGVPILAAVSAPSDLSVDFARELGITLAAFCRDDRLTIYSHPHRIK